MDERIVDPHKENENLEESVPHEEDEVPIQNVKCPWCPWIGDKESYSDHLQEKHYKGEPGERTGPYPKVE